MKLLDVISRLNEALAPRGATTIMWRSCEYGAMGDSPVTRHLTDAVLGYTAITPAHQLTPARGESLQAHLAVHRHLSVAPSSLSSSSPSASVLDEASMGSLTIVAPKSLARQPPQKNPSLVPGSAALCTLGRCYLTDWIGIRDCLNLVISSRTMFSCDSLVERGKTKVHSIVGRVSRAQFQLRLEKLHVGSLRTLRLHASTKEICDMAAMIVIAAKQFTSLETLSLEVPKNTWHFICDQWVLPLMDAMAHITIPLQCLLLPGINLLRRSAMKLCSALRTYHHLRLLELQDVQLPEAGWIELVSYLAEREPPPAIPLVIVGTWPDEQFFCLASVAETSGGACSVVRRGLIESIERDRFGIRCKGRRLGMSCVSGVSCQVCDSRLGYRTIHLQGFMWSQGMIVPQRNLAEAGA